MTRWSLTLVLLAGCRDALVVAPGVPDPQPPLASRRAESDLVEETPNPVAVRINREYTKPDADRWASSFEHDGREVFDHRAAIVAALGLTKGMRVADVGAGTGLFSLLFAAEVGPTGQVFAVDAQAYFVEHIEARAKAASLSNVIGQLADQSKTGLAVGSIQLAFLCDAYHHLERPKTYLADLRRAIVPGGRLVVIDYDRTRPGTRAWMKDHIRADPDQFKAEIQAAGFVLRETPSLLTENFVMIFERPGSADGS